MAYPGDRAPVQLVIVRALLILAPPVAACSHEPASGPLGGDAGESGAAPSESTSEPASPTSTGGADGTLGPGDDDGPKLDLAVPDVGAQPPVVPECDELDDAPTMLGCEFWSYNMSLWSGFQTGGIGIGNPWGVEVEVEIEQVDQLVAAAVLGPYEARIFEGQLFVPHRIRSSHPVTAMQISPLGAAASFVPEASTLLPTRALGTEYLGLGYGMNGFIYVVATEDDTTLSTAQGDVVLDAFDVPHLTVPADPTGYAVSSDKPIAVFSGAWCAYVPGDAGWCDHLEEQLLPISTWGTRYVAARHPQRMPELLGAPEAIVWRFIAAVDATTITITPPLVGVGAEIQLDAGGQFELSTDQSFVAEAAPDRPFMLVQYMTGGTNVVGDVTDHDDGPATGDPFMAQTVAIEQWLTALPFVTDVSYQRDFVTITREAGTTVHLACLGDVPDDHFSPIVGTSYEVGHVDLDLEHQGGEGSCQDGGQFITADRPIGILVGGVDCAASYGYPGAGALSSLWDPGGPAG